MNYFTISFFPSSSPEFSNEACFKFFSKTFFASQNPCFVLPNEFGPAEVGVSLKKNNSMQLYSAQCINNWGNY